jgi:23S rRNA (guanosine2251-2'-O)-methyltransferase
VRATAGSCFHVPVFVLSRDTIAATLREEFQLLGASSHGNVPLDRVELADRVALVLGHETRGLSPELSECLDKTVAIPMSERVESLNVAAAAAVVCWEVFRQRRIWSAGAEQSGAPALDDRMTR